MKANTYRCMLLAGFIISMIMAPLSAEGLLSMDYSLFNTVTINTESETCWGYTVGGLAKPAYKSTGNRNVKSEVSLNIAFPAIPVSETSALLRISLDKAYIKVRFPGFRFTSGKTRVSWGDGFVFNSGDIVFGSTGTSIDLTASEIRDQTYWLTSVNIPFGRFSFIEALVLPPPLSNIFLLESTIGTRIYTTLNMIKMESGYIYKGSETTHSAYLGFQGNFGADWYAASSLSLPAVWDSDALAEGAEESWNISCGLFYLYRIDRIRSMTLRFEGLIRPFGSWEEVDSDASSTYGILLYPEITYAPSDTIHLLTRSIISPIDLSAKITAGVSWNIFQSFSLIGYVTGNVGDSTDIFSWNSNMPETSSLAVMIGCTYIY